MRNFWRAIRLTFKYRWNIIGVILSSILLAVCWGGNIATVYPLVQVSFQGDSINSWLLKEIDNQEERLAKLEGERADLIKGLEPDAQGEEADWKKPILKDSQDGLYYENSDGSRVNLSIKDGRKLSLLNKQIDDAQKLIGKYKKYQPFVQRWTPDDPFLTVVLLMVFVLSVTLFKCVCTYTHSYLSTRLGQLGSNELRALFFKRMLGYETTFFTQRGIADATTRFTSDMGTLSNGLVLAYGKALREPMKLIVCLIGALLVSWQLLLFTFLFVPVAFILIRWLAKSLKRVVRRAMAEMAQLYGRIDETFRAIRVVKSFNRESFEEDKFAKVNSAYYRRGMKTAKYDALTSPLTETLGIGMLVIAIIAGSYLIIYQKTSLGGIPIASRPLDLGSLALFYGFLIGASDPARRLSDIFTSMQGACAAADRVYEVIDREVVIENSSDPKPLKKFEDSIVFDKVGYAYPVDSSFSLAGADARKRKKFEDVLKEGIHSLGKFVCRKKNSKATDEQASGDISTPSVEQHRVLHEASLEIKRGETIAIVGRSGCGKSTLLSMIPRFIDPTEGRVLVDGIPIKEIALSDLRDQIGLVAQDSVLFNDTVYENIRYGRLTATREEIIQAAKDAYADDFICHELINGYDTVVGPGGGALSGGQRQRIALARALLKDPQIFLLDEATSQIDLESERFIHEALKKFVGSRTTILITHRLTAIQLADRVVVMDDGRILFVGTHEEALKNSPFYQTLWKNELT